MGTYEQACRRIAQAKTSAELFGPLAGTTHEERMNVLRKAFRELVLLVHPDRHNGDAASIKSFRRLMELHAEAEGMLKSPVPKPGPASTIKTRKAVYELRGLLATGDTCDVYRGLRIGKNSKDTEVALKILRDADGLDLFNNGSQALRSLGERHGPDAIHFLKYLPALLEAVQVSQPDGSVRHAQMFLYDPDFIPLTRVLEAFPGGLDPRDAAWMGNRIFEILAWIHSKGYVHAAILPTHVIIRPADHAAQIIGWSASLKIGELPKVASPDYRNDYAPETFAHMPATPALDVYMAAQLISRLVGENALPKRLRGFLDACRLRQPSARFPDGRAACLDFKEALKELYGPPTFRPFAMPEKAG